VAGCKIQLINRKCGLKVTVPSGSVLGFWQGVLWDGWTAVSWIWRGQLLRMLGSSEGEYFLGMLSVGINAAGATSGREMMFPWCGECVVLLTWC